MLSEGKPNEPKKEDTASERKQMLLPEKLSTLNKNLKKIRDGLQVEPLSKEIEKEIENLINNEDIRSIDFGDKIIPPENAKFVLKCLKQKSLEENPHIRKIQIVIADAKLMSEFKNHLAHINKLLIERLQNKAKHELIDADDAFSIFVSNNTLTDVDFGEIKFTPKSAGRILELISDNPHIRNIKINIEDPKFQKDLSIILQRNKVLLQSLAMLIKEFSQILRIDISNINLVSALKGEGDVSLFELTNLFYANVQSQRGLAEAQKVKFFFNHIIGNYCYTRDFTLMHMAAKFAFFGEGEGYLSQFKKYHMTLHPNSLNESPLQCAVREKNLEYVHELIRVFGKDPNFIADARQVVLQASYEFRIPLAELLKTVDPKSDEKAVVKTLEPKIDEKTEDSPDHKKFASEESQEQDDDVPDIIHKLYYVFGAKKLKESAPKNIEPGSNDETEGYDLLFFYLRKFVSHIKTNPPPELKNDLETFDKKLANIAFRLNHAAEIARIRKSVEEDILDRILDDNSRDRVNTFYDYMNEYVFGIIKEYQNMIVDEVRRKISHGKFDEAVVILTGSIAHSLGASIKVLDRDKGRLFIAERNGLLDLDTEQEILSQKPPSVISIDFPLDKLSEIAELISMLQECEISQAEELILRAIPNLLQSEYAVVNRQTSFKDGICFYGNAKAVLYKELVDEFGELGPKLYKMFTTFVREQVLMSAKQLTTDPAWFPLLKVAEVILNEKYVILAKMFGVLRANQSDAKMDESNRPDSAPKPPQS